MEAVRHDRRWSTPPVVWLNKPQGYFDDERPDAFADGGEEQYMGYSALIQEGAVSTTCSHIHGSLAEALNCAMEQESQLGVSRTTVVGAELGTDGVPRHRDLTAAEEAELEALRGGA